MRWLLWAVGVLVAALVAWLAWPRPVEEPPADAPSPPALRAPAPDAGARAGRPSMVPARLPQEAVVIEEARPPPSPPPPPATGAPALAGLEVEVLTAADRERLRVPKAYGAGVRVTRVEADSPAAEVGLRPDDVILRAQRTDVASVRDLEAAVGGRDHTLLNVARDGQVMQTVLKTPFR